MNLRKDINMLIAAKIVEIVYVIAFIFVSIPLWQQMNEVTNYTNVFSYNGLTYTGFTVENELNYSMYPMANEDALVRVKPTKVIVANNSLTEEEYTITLKISKESTLDYNCLNIAINDLVMPINSMDKTEDKDNYYFVIDTNKLKGNTEEYLIKIWMDEQTGNEMQGKSLVVSFDLVESVTKI